MFVNPFVLGILATLFVEMAALIIWSLLSGRK
nr:MAG TPA: Heme exporter protein D (CcmD) [Bacteriophage sp.]